MAGLELNELHTAQLARLAQFFKGKRDRCFADRLSEKDEFKSDRLSDPGAIFNATDVEGMIDFYYESMAGHFREELEATANISAVYISQLLAQAEQMGASLQVDDISVVEDQSRLGQVSALAALQGAPPPVPKPRAALPTIDQTAIATDPSVVQEVQDLKAHNQQLTERFQQMQTEMASLLSERSTLTSELDKAQQMMVDMRARLSETPLDADTAHRLNEIDAALHQSQAALNEKSAEAEALRRDMGTRLADSSQFQDLKGLLRKKSDEVKGLRELLTAHGLAPPPPPEESGCIELTADDD
eukprot:TRINITY_DN7000_c0_g1_i1.p1 TRINITY_DN7000_c0_g1~~TRINITY_DN7000_c0_g1_i1.p1  ORF type:complete len:301 (-),score=92.84 TRINITY_DN7000_c0_g1_i1:192-1094(-)